MAKAKDLEEALTNIEGALGGSEKPHMDLGEHLEYIEELIEEGGGGGGTPVVANPELAGDEDDLQGLQVGDTKYKIPEGSSGGIGLDSADNMIGLAYDTSRVFVSADDGRSFETLSDYADFLNQYDGKEFLVSIVADPDTGNRNTETAIMWAYYEDNNNTEYVTLETAHGSIDISITEEDSEVVFNVDWSQAVNWAATGGGGSVESKDIIPDMLEVEKFAVITDYDNPENLTEEQWEAIKWSSIEDAENTFPRYLKGMISYNYYSRTYFVYVMPVDDVMPGDSDWLTCNIVSGTLSTLNVDWEHLDSGKYPKVKVLISYEEVY